MSQKPRVHDAVGKDLALLYQQAGFVQKAVEMWHQALAICPDAAMRQTIKDHLLRLI